MVQPWLTMVNHATMVNVLPRKDAGIVYLSDIVVNNRFMNLTE